jgi:rubrerythrin
MNVFEHAMKMEEDGRNYYLDQARQAKAPALRRILEELADDELKHYRLFKKMRDDQLHDDSPGFGTAIIATTKNVFDALKKEAESVTASNMGPVSIWEHARDTEKEAADFYREKAEEIDGNTNRSAFLRIAEEEHRHYVALDSVVKFLQEPKQWLADAEWSSLEE